MFSVKRQMHQIPLVLQVWEAHLFQEMLVCLGKSVQTLRD